MIGAIRAVCFALATTTPGERFDALPLLFNQFLRPQGVNRTFLLRPTQPLEQSSRHTGHLVLGAVVSCEAPTRLVGRGASVIVDRWLTAPLREEQRSILPGGESLAAPCYS